MNGVELIPSADRVIMSLRALGYDLPQAIADVVDNSVAAYATQIDINIDVEGDAPSISISDNGHGMSDGLLREALRYGSKREYGKHDLGKFGLGLKTASLSQCQALTVASRAKGARAISAYRWDIDHVSRTNRWEILRLDGKSLPKYVVSRLRDSCGTVVVWEHLDKLQDLDQLQGAVAKRRILQVCREVEAHLGMIYHRFLTGKVNGRKLAIRLNGVEIRSWDPLCEGEKRTRLLAPKTFNHRHNGRLLSILVEPAILPAQSEFSSLDAFKNAGGPMGWNLQQGFYFYRAGRMIQSGGWSRMRAPDEHTKLARIAVHFPSELDEAFKINVAKMRVQLPTLFRDKIEEEITSVVMKARERYSKKALATPGKIDSPTSVSKRSGSRKTGSNKPRKLSKVLLTLPQWTDIMLSVSRGKEKQTVRKVLMRLL